MFQSARPAGRRISARPVLISGIHINFSDYVSIAVYFAMLCLFEKKTFFLLLLQL